MNSSRDRNENGYWLDDDDNEDESYHHDRNNRRSDMPSGRRSDNRPGRPSGRQSESYRRRQRQLKLYRTITVAAMAVAFFVVAVLTISHFHGKTSEVEAAAIETASVAESIPAEQSAAAESESGAESASTGEMAETAATNSMGFFNGYSVEKAANVKQMSGDEEMQSEYAVLVDLDTGEVVAEKNSDTVIYPASMTKILTVLTAADHITDLNDKFTITQDITDYVFSNGCSAVNWDIGETVTVKDLLYGTVLQSGADAALGLADYCCGSEEAFVAEMNEKAKSLGLGNTAEFTSCIGVFNENNHCTVTDMAMILKAAVENDICREALSAHTYTTSSTTEHPDGIEISNWFLRRIEDKETGGTVECAKTGYVNESGNCAASYEVTAAGKHYICVTGNSSSAWRCIYDHVEIYSTYT